MKIRREILAAILFLCPAYALLPGEAPAFVSFPKAEGIDVASVHSDPYAYRGEITIRGAVRNADPGRKLFHVIDYREYRACRQVDCTIVWVTALHDGKLPAAGSVVEVTGVIEKNPAGHGGYVLRAKTVRVK